jgi:hypothetical protein
LRLIRSPVDSGTDFGASLRIVEDEFVATTEEVAELEESLASEDEAGGRGPLPAQSVGWPAVHRCLDHCL